MIEKLREKYVVYVISIFLKVALSRYVDLTENFKNNIWRNF